MFKEIKSGLQKCLTKEFVLVVLIFGVLAWGLFSYSNQKISNLDAMQDGSGVESAVEEKKEVAAPTDMVAPSSANADAGYALQQVANPTDLLPNDKNSQWSELNPSALNSEGTVSSLDALQAGHHIGVDTVGQCNRNANLQLRSDIPITKMDIGPWNQSTISSCENFHKPLEIGA